MNRPDTIPDLAAALAGYRACLERLRHGRGAAVNLPDVPFFLLGMGNRRKLLYRAGTLSDARTGEVLQRWDVASELIVPSIYTVAITTHGGQKVEIVEDEQGVWLITGAGHSALSESRLLLPTFSGHPYAPVLRVLHQEVLVNIVNGLPVPNFFVYPRPWYRDGAMMAMVLRETGNLDLLHSWIAGLSDPYDSNNGEAEPDNLGQALMLISLVSDRFHPLVPAILAEMARCQVANHVEGRTDGAAHPVYQTKWAKSGLSALRLHDSYSVPLVPDSYSALVWWAYRDWHVDDGSRFPRHVATLYPYLAWAQDHFYGRQTAPVGNRDYPLTWEARASQAQYAGMARISPLYTEQSLCAPHTWHAAEMFLHLLQPPLAAPKGGGTP